MAPHLNRKNFIVAVCPVSHLILSKSASLNIQGFVLDNHKSLEGHEIFKVGFGEDYIEYLSKNPSFYFYDKKEILTEFIQTDNLRLIAINMVDVLTAYINSTWLVKDNSINIKRLVMYSNIDIANDLKLLSFTTASGEFVETELSQEELNKTFDLFIKLNHILSSETDPSAISKKDKGYVSSESFSTLYNSYNRIVRAYNFLTTARSESNAISKIANMIAALECLFLYEKEGLSSQLRRRIPEYIGLNKVEKQDIEKCIKEAYNIRSKYFHGDKVPNKYNSREKINPLVIYLDSILRKIFIKIIENDSHYFIKKIEFKKLLQILEPLAA